MISQLFKFLLEKKVSFCVALVIPWLIWAASGATFGAVIILDKADFQNGAKESFILTLFLGMVIAMFFILIEFGLSIFLNRKLENKDAKIVNDNVIKGKIRKGISNEDLVNLYYSLDKVYNLLSVRNWQWTLTITIVLSFVDYFNSSQLSTTLMILTVGFVVAFLTNIYNTTLAGGELMFPLRKECKEMLNSRRLFYKDIFTTSLQEKFRMFIILIIFLFLLILFFSYPLTPNLIIISLIGLAMAITIIRVIFLSFYSALNEIQLLAENMGRGEKVVFYSGSADREIITLEKSLNRTAENIKEYQTNLEEAKTTLEIKVKARTQELKELTEELEEKVRERTKGLEKRTKELEESKTALINILEDAGESKEEVVEERDKTLSIINNFADGLLIFDAENKISLINPLAQDFLKVRPGDIEQNSILELAKLPNFQPLVNVLGKELKEIFRKELSLTENLAIELSTIPIIRGNKKIGTLAILHDVTREKMIERMKTEFVSLSAHQLRTPLAAIKWTLRMILDGDLGPITEEQRTFLEKTYQSNERMINLINDLLNVTRIEEGKYLHKPVPVNLEEIVRDLLDSHKEETERKKLRLEFKKPEKKLPKIMLDVEKMELAIENLLNNAISYTPSGGQIIISLKEAEKGIEFSIQDTGIGISKEQQERVFTKFFRGTNAIKADTEGTGLGLFIAKNIIGAHGGKIWFETKEGIGTTFRFTLPIEVKEEPEDFLKKF